MNKGIAAHNMNSSSSKEFELNIKLLNLTWFSLTTIRRTYQHFQAAFNKEIMLTILVGYPMTITISSVTITVSNPTHTDE